MTLSIPEYDILVRFALPATPLITEIKPLWVALQRQELLSIQAATGERKRARVHTTDAGMRAVRETEGRR